MQDESKVLHDSTLNYKNINCPDNTGRQTLQNVMRPAIQNQASECQTQKNWSTLVFARTGQSRDGKMQSDGMSYPMANLPISHALFIQDKNLSSGGGQGEITNKNSTLQSRQNPILLRFRSAFC